MGFAIRFMVFSLIVMAFLTFAPPRWKNHETALMIGFLALAGILFIV